MKKMTLINEKGFALLAAILACLILLAIGLLVINTSTGNLMNTATYVGGKKAMIATESGIYKLGLTLNPNDIYGTSNAFFTGATNCALGNYNWNAIDNGVDGSSQFAICAPNVAIVQPPPVCEPGDDCTKVQTIIVNGYTILGRNTNYNTLNVVEVGIKYGPYPIQ